MRRRCFVARALVLAACAPAVASERPLPADDNLAALAAESAAQGRPLVLFFTTPGCPYCAEVRRNYLAPRVAGATGTPPLLMREVDITGRNLLTGFDGRLVAAAELAARYQVRVVPVVLAVDARGRPLGEPLVGLDSAGFYDSRLQALLSAAADALGR
jgi:thioredoxin-related protein